MNTDDRNFYLGSFFLTFGVMLLTVIPMLSNILDLNIIIDNREIYTYTLLSFIIGAILYVASISNFKKQLIWLFSLIAFFVGFQLMFLHFRFFIY